MKAAKKDERRHTAPMAVVKARKRPGPAGSPQTQLSFSLTRDLRDAWHEYLERWNAQSADTLRWLIRDAVESNRAIPVEET